MSEYYRIGRLTLCWLVFYDVILSLNANSNGFILTHFSGSNMVFINCDAAYLPSDVIAFHSLSIARKSLRQGGKSQVIASLRNPGKCRGLFCIDIKIYSECSSEYFSKILSL